MRKQIKVFVLVCLLSFCLVNGLNTTVAVAQQTITQTVSDLQQRETEQGYVTVAKKDSITDIMDDWDKQNTPDAKAMKKYDKELVSPISIILSCIIWLIFALIAFTTACDLLYIVMPGIRPLLYKPQTPQQSPQTPQGRGAMSQSVQQPTQTQDKPAKAWISQELRQLVSTQQIPNQANPKINGKPLIAQYFKVRGIVVVITVVALVILLTTSIFTDIGLNIGQVITDFFNTSVKETAP